jgi:hypothetical protein
VFLLVGIGYIGTLGGVEPLFCVRTGYCNIVGLLNSLSIEAITDMGTFDKEIAFQICDKKTRETRKLVKLITIMDLAEFSLFGNGNDSRFFKSLGDSSKTAAVVYPQLLGKTVLINPPSFFKVLYTVCGQSQYLPLRQAMVWEPGPAEASPSLPRRHGRMSRVSEASRRIPEQRLDHYHRRKSRMHDGGSRCSERP